MKIAVLIARILLGLVMAFFGLNGFLHFLPQPHFDGDIGTFIVLMTNHHWFVFVAFCELLGGIFLLLGRFVPLGLTILAAVLANVLVYHIGFEIKSIGPGVVCTMLNLFLIYAYRDSFRPLFDAHAHPTI